MLFRLHMDLGSLYCKQYGPRSESGFIVFASIANNMDPDQTATLGSSLIRIHSGCFQCESILQCFLIYAADVISRQEICSELQNKG